MDTIPPTVAVPEEVVRLRPMIEEQVENQVFGYALLFGTVATRELLARLVKEYAPEDGVVRMDLSRMIMTLADALADPDAFVDGMTETAEEHREGGEPRG